jgi:hypothetical protein
VRSLHTDMQVFFPFPSLRNVKDALSRCKHCVYTLQHLSTVFISWILHHTLCRCPHMPVALCWLLVSLHVCPSEAVAYGGHPASCHCTYVNPFSQTGAVSTFLPFCKPPHKWTSCGHLVACVQRAPI